MYSFNDLCTIIRDWKDTEKAHPCIVDSDKFPRYLIGDIIDENKSVKWNEEKVAESRKAYTEEQIKLFKAEEDAFEKIESDIIDMIANEMIANNLFDEKIARFKAERLYYTAKEDCYFRKWIPYNKMCGDYRFTIEGLLCTIKAYLYLLEMMVIVDKFH